MDEATTPGPSSAYRVTAVRAELVIYVQGLDAMRAFYVGCLQLVLVEQDDTTAMLENEGWTLHLVTVPAAVAATIELSDPPRRRAGTPLKPVFEVAAIEALRGQIAELGGKLDPPERGRAFGGTRRLDALDPEGNVIQLLQADSPRNADPTLGYGGRFAMIHGPSGGNVCGPMESSIDWEQARALNLAKWEALAELHGQDAYYDTEALVAGRDTLTPEDNDALRASVSTVSGLDVLHVQCHIGFDTISLARRGARVTGVDFSPAALAKAAAIADRCGVEIEWVLADSTAIGPSLAGRFDLAFATIGVVCWIADIDAWMRSVHATLRPGGQLILIDTHPLHEMLATGRPLTFDMSYADAGGYVFEDQGSYAVQDAELAGREVCYAHSLGEIVSAAVAAGLRIDELTEHLRSSFEHRIGIPQQEDDGWWRLRADGQPLPLLFTLRATRPVDVP